MRKNLFILFGVISFWSVLIGAAWAYLPVPLAAISSAVHSYGLVVTTAPILSAWSDCPGRLSLPGAINPFDSSLDRGRAWGGDTLASQITQPGSDSNISPLSGETWNGRGAGTLAASLVIHRLPSRPDIRQSGVPILQKASKANPYTLRTGLPQKVMEAFRMKQWRWVKLS